MGEITPEGAISPVQSVESNPPKVRKSFFPKISLPNPVRLFGKRPSPEAAVDITPAAVQTTDFVPPAAAIETDTAPVNATAPDFSAAPSAETGIDAKAVADLTAQMTAQVTAPFPGAQPPEAAPSFTAPTNPPTETATASPTVIGSEVVTPTPINSEVATGTLTGSVPVEQKPAA